MLMKDVFTPENIYQNVCINNASREEALELLISILNGSDKSEHP